MVNSILPESAKLDLKAFIWRTKHLLGFHSRKNLLYYQKDKFMMNFDKEYIGGYREQLKAMIVLVEKAV